ncbi:MAG: response regulator transcription factor [Lachnospiraceae bacterium]|jgi:two-component system response regulator LytT|nr:response regulator transcription factor [Lachnospiraceae bacterium]MDE6991952.1 LytTR family DNA-binding domain-containing protein [Lachnospiraceae bacterium]MDE7000807.1 LytTR family DNA-binding domain-containing protein [Lachnospiraceae bacterium]
MIQTAVCDDEPFYREKISSLVKQYFEKHDLDHAIHLYPSGEAFLARHENTVKYDVVFMDISMKALDGIQTAARIRAYHSDTQLVFVTAFIDYALEGYKFNAVRYIMKDTLDSAIPECMDAILQKMRLAQVTFPFMDGEATLYTDNILYIESRKHKSFFYYMQSDAANPTASRSGAATYQIYEKLDSIEQKLSDHGFLRIHKSYLVNMKHIRRLGNYTAFLDTGAELPIPRLRYQTVKEQFVAYKGIL